MSVRLQAIDAGPDIVLNRPMVVVGRHPACDARLDSLRVSRHHCCMTLEDGVVVVRDLGSTNGIRINGQRVEFGRLRPGDELSIAHLRYRLEAGWERDRDRHITPPPMPMPPITRPAGADQSLALGPALGLGARPAELGLTIDASRPGTARHSIQSKSVVLGRIGGISSGMPRSRCSARAVSGAKPA